MEQSARPLWVRSFLLAAAVLGGTGGQVLAAVSAVGDYCPVCLVERGQRVAGRKEHQIVFDRQVYSFASEEHLRKFQANPQLYMPALAGDCPVCLTERGQRIAGKLELGMKYDNRLFLFATSEHQARFKANPQKYANADLGLGGQCPVTILEEHKWVPGNLAHESCYDGIRYHFFTPAAKQRFDADPGRYAPALGGNCIVCYRDAGRIVPGTPYYATEFEGRTYLFPSETLRQIFLNNYAVYADFDVAGRGNCPVCAKEGRANPGRREFTSVYKGLTYKFVTKEHKDAFDANPAEYVGFGARGGLPAQSLATTAPSKLTTVSGKAGCAYCDYRVRTKTDPDSLGLAVITQDKIFIVERAEKLYPEIFEDRYEAFDIEVIGHTTHVQGRFVWIEPVMVRKTPAATTATASK